MWAWLGFRRATCPTLQELDESRKREILLQQKVKNLQEKDQKLREEEIKKGNYHVVDGPLEDYQDTLRFFEVQEMYQESNKARDNKQMKQSTASNRSSAKKK